MSEITDIKVAKGKKARRHIYIDDEYVCTLDEFTVFKHKLAINQEITNKELEEIALESETSSAFERVVELISKTPKTSKQIMQYLREKGYLLKVRQAVLSKLEEYHFINDEAYAQNYVNCYKNKYGKQKLAYLLLQKGISKQIIDRVLIDLETQEDAVLQIANKYLKGKERNPQNYNKLCRYLIGKGFSWADISGAIGVIKSEE